MNKEQIEKMNPITFTIDGIPKAQPRARAFAKRMGSKFVARVYDAGTAENWKSCIAIAARDFIPASPLQGAVQIDIDLLFPRPQRLMTRKYPDGELWHTAKPDRDNSDKAVLDCLKVLGFLADDCIVCAGQPRKLYHSKNGKPGARIRIQQLETAGPSAGWA